MKHLKTPDKLILALFLLSLPANWLSQGDLTTSILFRLILFLLCAIGGYWLFAYPKELRFGTAAAIINGILTGIAFYFLLMAMNLGILHTRFFLYAGSVLFLLNAIPLLPVFFLNKAQIKSQPAFKRGLIRVAAPLVLLLIVTCMSNRIRVLLFHGPDSFKQYELLQGELTGQSYAETESGNSQQGVLTARKAIQYSLLRGDSTGEHYQKTMNALAYAYYLNGEYYLADSVLEKNMLLPVPEFDEVSGIRGKTIYYRGLNYSSWGYYRLSDSLLQSCISTTEDGLSLAYIYKVMGQNANNSGRLATADSLYLLSLSTGGTTDPLYYTGILRSMGSNYGDMNAYTKADSVYKKALSLALSEFGAESRETATIYNELSALNYDLAKYDSSLLYIQKYAGVIRKLDGEESSGYLYAQMGLSKIKTMLSGFEEAEQLLLNTLSVIERKHNVRGSLASYAYECLSKLYADYANYDKAEEYAEKCLIARKYWSGLNSITAADALDQRAYIYYCKGNYAMADSFYRATLSIKYALTGTADKSYYHSLNGLGLVYSATGKLGKADTIFNYCLQATEKFVGSLHPHMSIVLCNTGYLRLKQNDTEKAFTLFSNATGITHKIFQKENLLTAEALTGLARCYSKQGRKEQARLAYTEAIAIYEKIFHFIHPKRSAIQKELMVLK